MTHPKTEPISEAAVQGIGAALYGPTPALHRFHSEESRVYRLDFAGARPDKTLKVPNEYAHFVTDEQAVMRALLGLGLEVPRIEFTQEDHPQAPCPFTAMPLIVGQSFEDIYRCDPRSAFRTFDRIGRFIAGLASIPLGSVPGGAGTEEAQENALDVWWERQHFALRQHALCCDDFERIFQEARVLMTPPPTAFGHRGGVEVITDGGPTFAVVDWRDGGATWPHADLGQFLFGVKAWKGGWHDDLLPPLLDGYLGGRPLDAGTAHVLCIWEAYQALLIALYLDGLGRAEWTPHLIGIAASAISAGKRHET